MAGHRVHLRSYNTFAAGAASFLPDWYHFSTPNRKAVARLISRYYARWTPAKVADALGGWLDAMEMRLADAEFHQYIGQVDIEFARCDEAAIPQAA